MSASQSWIDAAAEIFSRAVMPNNLSSDQLVRLDQQIKSQSFFMAHVEDARLLQRARSLLGDYMEQSRETVIDPQGRPRSTLKVGSREEFVRQMRDFMVSEGMVSEGDLSGIEKGAVTDVTSRTRWNLVFDTNVENFRSRAQVEKSRTPGHMDAFPAWELVRISSRMIPRNWPERWATAGGEMITGRMIALKSDSIWSALGDPGIFPDAIGTDRPPFAWNSGMGWREVSATEWQELTGTAPPSVDEPEIEDDPPQATTKSMDADIKLKLLERLKDRKAQRDARLSNYFRALETADDVRFVPF